MNVFETLNKINVNEHVEKKNGLSYLSWAWAWAEVKKAFPDATYTVYENRDGLLYHTDGMTAWVKTGVTIGGIEHIEYLPVMDFKNKSITVDKITSFDVNKAVQRSLTKACARHGLGLYIYAGEDLPEGETTPKDDRTELLRTQVIELARLKGLEEQMRSADYNGKKFDDLDEKSLADLKVKLTRRASVKREANDEGTSE